MKSRNSLKKTIREEIAEVPGRVTQKAKAEG